MTNEQREHLGFLPRTPHRDEVMRLIDRGLREIDMCHLDWFAAGLIFDGLASDILDLADACNMLQDRETVAEALNALHPKRGDGWRYSRRHQTTIRVAFERTSFPADLLEVSP